MDLQADAHRRYRIYRRLDARNRVVAVLRIAVPVLGVLVLAALMAQIYLSSLGGRFGVGQVSITRDTILVDAPEYTGLLDDGTSYHVSATKAQAGTDAPHRIQLSHAALTMERLNGVSTLVTADAAILDTVTQQVEIAGVAHVEESTGTRATLHDTVFDYRTQMLTGRGPALVDYADGTNLVADAMNYDVLAQVWTFTRASVTLPDTPGAGEEPQ